MRLLLPQFPKQAFILFLLSTGPILCYSQCDKDWKSLNPYPQTEGDLNGIHVFSADKAIAVGSNGTVLRTNDEGADWERTSCNAGSSELNAVYFVGQHQGFIAGENGTILRTSDGGANWEALSSGSSNKLNDLHFPNLLEGWVTGTNGTLLRTEDKGNNWESVPVSTNSSLHGVYFLSDNTGWVVGDNGTILHTSDGGSTWSPQGGNLSADLFSVHFSNSSYGWIAGENGTVLYTSDGGNSWQTRNSSFSGELYSVTSEGPLNSILAGSNGKILRTSNGGLTWTDVSPSTFDNIYTVHSQNLSNTWGVGANGRILRTENFGDSWEQNSRSISSSLSAVEFINENKGWIGGGSGKVWYSPDGGHHLKKRPIQPDTNIYNFSIRDLEFVDSSLGWAISIEHVFKTTNGGRDWRRADDSLLEATTSLRGAHFKDDGSGWVAGGYITNKILFTPDSGKSWNLQRTTDKRIHDIHSPSASYVYAVADSGIVFRSPDEGQSWDTLHTPYSSFDHFGTPSYAVHFVNDSVGYIANESLGVARTSNAGEDWTQSGLDADPLFRDLFFRDAAHGKVIAAESIIYSTSDSGKSWTQESSAEADLNELQYASNGRWWTVGDAGTFLTRSAGPISDIPHFTRSSKKKIEIHPNPVRSQVEILFPQSTEQELELIVRNVRGKRVKSEMLDPGKEEVRLELGALKSGVYFLQFQSERLSKAYPTQKLVVR